MDGKFVSFEAKAACKALHFTPREFEPVNADRPIHGWQPGDDEFAVLRIWNSRREITLTNHDIAYAGMYLR